MSTFKQEASLRNWRFHGLTACGEAYGHPQFPNGKRVHTSEILRFNKRSGVIETLHTFYRLEDYDESEKVDEIRELERRLGKGLPDVPADARPLR